jgi:hypothetical protein
MFSGFKFGHFIFYFYRPMAQHFTLFRVFGTQILEEDLISDPTSVEKDARGS